MKRMNENDQVQARKRQLTSWVILEYIIDHLREQMKDHPEVWDWTDKMIVKLCHLQSSLSETKPSFTEYELSEIMRDMRNGPGPMGPDPQSNIRFLFLLVE